MAKDPAALFFIDQWLVATAEMPADCRGWFLNLVLHQFDKGDLPDDIEELASLAQVRFSEFNRFQQIWQQVLEKKYNKTSAGRLENPFAAEIIRSRADFKATKSLAGVKSAFLTWLKPQFSKNEDVRFISFVKKELTLKEISQHISTEGQQNTAFYPFLLTVLLNKFSTYINTNINTDKNKPEGGAGGNPIPELSESGTHGEENPTFAPTAIVPQMVSTFRASFPDYAFDQPRDFAAGALLLKKLAKWMRIPPGHATGPRENEILRRWGEIVTFCAGDKWFAGRSLSDLANEFQRLTQSFQNRAKDAKHAANTQGNVPAKFVGF